MNNKLKTFGNDVLHFLHSFTISLGIFTGYLLINKPNSIHVILGLIIGSVSLFMLVDLIIKIISQYFTKHQILQEKLERIENTNKQLISYQNYVTVEINKSIRANKARLNRCKPNRRNKK